MEVEEGVDVAVGEVVDEEAEGAAGVDEVDIGITIRRRRRVERGCRLLWLRVVETIRGTQRKGYGRFLVICLEG